MYQTLKQRLTDARFEVYETAAQGVDQNALALYEWNLSISAAMFEDIAVIEVLVRNTIDIRLRRKHQQTASAPPWYDTLPLPDPAKKKVKEAKEKIERAGKSVNQDRVIAELTFGFWRYFFGRPYKSTVWPVIRGGFNETTGGPVERQVADAEVGWLFLLRNRIAHHEPIFNLCDGQAHKRVRRLASWMCPVTSDWMAQRSRVPSVLEMKPAFLAK